MAAKVPHSNQKSPFNGGLYSSNPLGLFAIILTVVSWAIAANVANRLFQRGVQPFELAGASAMIATFGLAILDSFFGRSHAKPINRQQFALGLILVGLVSADYLAIQQLPVAVAIVLLFTAPILVVLWTALATRSTPSRSVLVALTLSVIGVIIERSHSRMLAQEFIDKWSDCHPEVNITYRDLGLNPVPYIDETWVTAKFTLPDQYTPELAAAIKLSDQLIDEFLSADCYVLSTPMYNFSIPAVLKSYIDHIVRPRRTFAVDANGFKGLVTDKKMLVITVRGSDFRPGSALETSDFQEPFLRTVFNFIGITEIQFINANGLNCDIREQSLAEARTAIQDLALCW